MADVKWIQIVTDIFDNWKIKQIKAMPEGHTMVCIWFEMLCMAGKQNENGFISFTGKLVTTEELLAVILNEDIKIVQMALSVFESLEMITIVNDSDIQINNWCEYQNTDGLNKIREQGRARQKKFREKQKTLNIEEKSNVTVTLPVTHSSYSISNSISNNSSLSNVYKEIIDYLNISINSNYKHTTGKTQTCIKARLNEGFTVDDFKMVIDKKSREWLGTDMAMYLRPETLFGTKFESYLNQQIVEPSKKNGKRDLFAELMSCEVD